MVREPLLLLLVRGTLISLLLERREALSFRPRSLCQGLYVTQEASPTRAEALRDLATLAPWCSAMGRLRGGRRVARGDLFPGEGDRVPPAASSGGNDLTMRSSAHRGSLPGKAARRPVYSGTLVVKGQGRAEVTATGPRTEFGRIGASLATLDIDKTRLQSETARIVRAVAGFAVGFCLLLIAYYVATRGDWLAGILAGVTLAMAILPEEFPVVLTVFLAIGAWRIARDGVLTRRMPAIETLGAATVLCVDKTGTLTENRMALVETIAPGGCRRVSSRALACELEPFDPWSVRFFPPRATPPPRAAHLDARAATIRSRRNFSPCATPAPPAGERASDQGRPRNVLELCGSMPWEAGAMEEVDARAGAGGACSRSAKRPGRGRLAFHPSDTVSRARFVVWQILALRVPEAIAESGARASASS